MASDGDNVERLIDLGIVPTLINLLQVNSVFVIYKVCLYRKLNVITEGSCLMLLLGPVYDFRQYREQNLY